MLEIELETQRRAVKWLVKEKQQRTLEERLDQETNRIKQELLQAFRMEKDPKPPETELGKGNQVPATTRVEEEREGRGQENRTGTEGQGYGHGRTGRKSEGYERSRERENREQVPEPPVAHPAPPDNSSGDEWPAHQPQEQGRLRLRLQRPPSEVSLAQTLGGLRSPSTFSYQSAITGISTDPMPNLNLSPYSSYLKLG